jgi:hypothetical protein
MVRRLPKSTYELCTRIQEFRGFYSFCWPRFIEVIRDPECGVDANPTLSANTHLPIATAFRRLLG